MKKRILTLLCILCTALVLCACTVTGNPLPDGMDETALLAAGEEIIADLNAGNWQEIFDQLREDAQTSTGSPAAIQAHMESVLAKVGPFEKLKDTMVTGQTVKETGEKYATAVFYCEHDKNQAMYRIAFSTDMELIGLQVTKQ